MNLSLTLPVTARRAAVLSVAVLLLSVDASAQNGFMDGVRRSVVKITVTGSAPDGTSRTERGTGFFIDPFGHILTAAHVVGTAAEWQEDVNRGQPIRTIDVVGLDQNSIQVSYTAAQAAVVVYLDSQSDLALLRVLGANFRPLRLANSLDVTDGDSLQTVGYGSRPAPVPLPATVILPFDPQPGGAYMRLRTGVAPADSGAPVLNARGEVVGVINGAPALHPTAGEAFATPSNLATTLTMLAGRKADDVPIGTVIASLLEPGLFFGRYDPGSWAPADGRAVPADSSYAVLVGTRQLPDLRAMFLRGLNTFDPAKGPRNDGKEDPDGAGRRVGETQDQRVASHKHTIGTGATDVTNSQMTSASRRIPTYINDVYAAAPAFETGPNDSSGENRPRNVAVYYYVKIN